MNLTQMFRPVPMFFRRHKLVRFLLQVSPESRVQLVEFNGGAKLYADLSDAFPRSHFLTRSFEPEFFAIALPFLKRGGVFFDVGANFGFCTFGILHSLRNIKIESHLFEANPEICALLQKSFGLYPGKKGQVCHACVSDHAGRSTLKVVPGHLGSSHISPDGALQVPNITLDAYAQQNQISKIDFIKMDIEGFEPRALAGSERLLAERVIKALYIEISIETLARQKAAPETCFHLLEKHGYRLFYVKPVDLAKPELQNQIQKLNIYGEALPVVPLYNFPNGHQTDILALPQDSVFLKRGPT